MKTNLKVSIRSPLIFTAALFVTRHASRSTVITARCGDTFPTVFVNHIPPFSKQVVRRQARRSMSLVSPSVLLNYFVNSILPFHTWRITYSGPANCIRSVFLRPDAYRRDLRWRDAKEEGSKRGQLNLLTRPDTAPANILFRDEVCPRLRAKSKVVPLLLMEWISSFTSAPAKE